MPKGNIIGNRRFRFGKSGSPFTTVNAQVSRSLAGLTGYNALGWKRLHEMGVSGKKYRLLLAIKLYCLHKHKNKTITDLCTIYNQRTDVVRRMLHSTKRMFDKWRELNESEIQN